MYSLLKKLTGWEKKCCDRAEINNHGRNQVNSSVLYFTLMRPRLDAEARMEQRQTKLQRQTNLFFSYLLGRRRCDDFMAK